MKILKIIYCTYALFEYASQVWNPKYVVYRNKIGVSFAVFAIELDKITPTISQSAKTPYLPKASSERKEGSKRRSFF